MARNAAQHPQHIGFRSAKRSQKDFEKYKQSFFADEDETRLFRARRGHNYDWDNPPLDLKMMREKPAQATSEIERLCAFLDKRAH
jgi:hypothetical protein